MTQIRKLFAMKDQVFSAKQSSLSVLTLLLLTACISVVQAQTELSPDGILFPNKTTVQRDNLSASQGQCIFNTTTSQIECWDGTAWIPAAAGGGGGGTSLWSENGGDVYRPTGNVGIGDSQPSQKLDVAGSIQIANSSNPSPPITEAGTIRYNSTENDFEGWNGSKWVSLTQSNQNWGVMNATENQKVNSGFGDDNDQFGYAVSISGNYAVIGAPDAENLGVQTGVAYILEYFNGEWHVIQELVASDAEANDGFGVSVSMDGNYIIIGSPYNDDAGLSSGSAYIFENDNGFWSEFGKITAPDANSGAEFGNSVSISGDYAVIGSHEDNDNGNNSGSAYVFTKNGNFYVFQSKLLPSSGTADDLFGKSVSISGDLIIVGSSRHDAAGFASGSSFVYERTGINWNQINQITPAGVAAYDVFGFSVSIDGDEVVIGAPLDDDAGYGTGSAYVLKRNGNSWTLIDKLVAPTQKQGAFFGASVHLSGDYIIVGAYGENGLKGAAYLYEKRGTTWYFSQKFAASDTMDFDEFGKSVTIDGDNIFIGSPYSDSNGYTDNGNVYIFRK